MSAIFILFLLMVYTPILLLCDGEVRRTYSQNEYVEAMQDAAQLDWEMNSPEMNNGIQQHHVIELQ